MYDKHRRPGVKQTRRRCGVISRIFPGDKTRHNAPRAAASLLRSRLGRIVAGGRFGCRCARRDTQLGEGFVGSLIAGRGGVIQYAVLHLRTRTTGDNQRPVFRRCGENGGGKAYQQKDGRKPDHPDLRAVACMAWFRCDHFHSVVEM
ncbi:hypothetical protein [Sphingomonas sp. BAUL-RG-20F-R05-02]|uniref:hypothetical protein n=1 Tax=Sphingomonas sp. BAUL-RG-20F-R05-02 TaxID=2914830 RepID=UPI001F567D29|nr:hypothetical protein [Sphingomonas sp. BAUL-RG-20F-R05-02]